MLKRVLRKFVIIMIILLIFTGVAIVIANNYIADKIEKELVHYQMPENTEVVDSLSIAGKITGSGNGMQYMGAILVKSELSEEDLKTYYSREFEFIEVRKQISPELEFDISGNYSFDSELKLEEGNYFSIICWDSERKEIFGDFISKLLELDIRGH